MQVHYNLLAGPRARPQRRRAPADPGSADGVRALQTRLLPAPVELPCRPQHADGPLCERPAALADVKKRFGEGPGSTADLLHLLCGPVKAGPGADVHPHDGAPETVRGVAGHMHLLGRSIKIEVNPGTPEARTLLDIGRGTSTTRAADRSRPGRWSRSTPSG